MSEPDGRLAAILGGGKPALARAINAIERDRFADDRVALLDMAHATPKGRVLGITGPPGVGKSTLTRTLIASTRQMGLTVGVLAIDPSSRLSGGALLGDRTRLRADPDDDGVFIRSMAAGDRLGGLSGNAVAATVLMKAVLDRVIVESVGVGQSEADIGLVADVTLLCIQPGSGDSLQFMKAGIMELPDLIAVTKADMGAPARRAVADVEGALSLGLGAVPVHSVSAATGEGIAELVTAVEAHAGRAPEPFQWLERSIANAFGHHGLAIFRARRDGSFCERPFEMEKNFLNALTRRWEN